MENCKRFLCDSKEEYKEEYKRLTNATYALLKGKKTVDEFNATVDSVLTRLSDIIFSCLNCHKRHSMESDKKDCKKKI